MEKNSKLGQFIAIFLVLLFFYWWLSDRTVNGVPREQYQEIVANYDSLSLRYTDYVEHGRVVGYITDPGIENLRFSYIFFHAREAQEIYKYHGIPASIVMAQMCLESDFGTSELARKYHNHFNIKHIEHCQEQYDTVFDMECCIRKSDDNSYDHFLKFKSDEKCLKAYAKLLKKKRYDDCFKCKSLKCWAGEIKEAGFATADNYAGSLLRIIHDYKLRRLDTNALYTLTPKEIENLIGIKKKK